MAKQKTKSKPPAKKVEKPKPEPPKPVILKLGKTGTIRERVISASFEALDGTAGYRKINGIEYRFLLQKPAKENPYVLVYDPDDILIEKVDKS